MIIDLIAALLIAALSGTMCQQGTSLDWEAWAGRGGVGYGYEVLAQVQIGRYPYLWIVDTRGGTPEDGVVAFVFRQDPWDSHGECARLLP